MTIGQEFLKEVDSELQASRRLVERVPSDKVRWKPILRPDPAIHLKRRKYCCANSTRMLRASERHYH
jgi:hypothetical protein